MKIVWMIISCVAPNDESHDVMNQLENWEKNDSIESKEWRYECFCKHTCLTIYVLAQKPNGSLNSSIIKLYHKNERMVWTNNANKENQKIRHILEFFINFRTADIECDIYSD